ncbi:MAG TPA: TIGR03086 family metal-binding protein [Actinoplanes sp.]|nr:TIGR03086 family metal-binding protein [Actinoplanes sp.]
MADRVPLDFDPPVRQLRALLLGITNDDLRSPTPCDGWTVGDLLDHIVDFTRAYSQAAQKLTDAPGTLAPLPRPAAAHLPPYWRSRLPVMLEELATSWKDPAAWTGSAMAGGAMVPAAATATAAVNELTMHGWDLARATGQDFAADPRILEVLIEFLSQSPDASGPAMENDDERAMLEQALTLSGRNPAWRAERPRMPPPRGASARSTSAAD